MTRMTRTLRRRGRLHSRQDGATLVVALIFLVLMSLFAINAFLGSSTNLRVVGNMQARKEATDAAQAAIEQVISSNGFASTPNSVIEVEIDKDKYTVTTSARCYRVRPVKNSEINPLGPDGICVRSSGAGGAEVPEGVVLSDNSFCSDAEWDITATATTARTNVSVTLNQGIGIRMLESDATDNCK